MTLPLLLQIPVTIDDLEGKKDLVPEGKAPT